MGKHTPERMDPLVYLEWLAIKMEAAWVHAGDVWRKDQAINLREAASALDKTALLRQRDEYKAQRDEALEAFMAISSLLHRGLHNPMPDAPTVEAAALEARDIARATIQSIEENES